MSYVALEAAKSFLNVYFTEKDGEIQRFIDAAERHVAVFLNRSLADPDPFAQPGDSPADAAIGTLPNVQLGVLYYVNDFWQNREITITGTIVAKNDTAERLLYPYRDELGV